jgi:hypothetical protein
MEFWGRDPSTNTPERFKREIGSLKRARMNYNIFGYNKKEAEELSEPAQAAQILPLSLFKAGNYRLMY